MGIGSGKVFEYHYPPEVVLAELIGKKFGTVGISPNPEQLKEWINCNWAMLSMLAHAIHLEKEPLTNRLPI